MQHLFRALGVAFTFTYPRTSNTASLRRLGSAAKGWPHIPQGFPNGGIEWCRVEEGSGYVQTGFDYESCPLTNDQVQWQCEGMGTVHV